MHKHSRSGHSTFTSRPGTSNRLSSLSPVRRISPSLVILGLLFYIFCSLLLRRSFSDDGANAPRLHESVKVLRDILFNKVVANTGALPGDSDYDAQGAHPMRLEALDPLYNVRVLRTILQHQNNTWQDMKGEARGFFIQSLLWMQVIGAARPDLPNRALSAECRFPARQYPVHNPIEDDRQTSLVTQGRVHAYATHPGDRGISHNFPFFVDCQLPDELQDQAHKVQNVYLDLRFEAGQLHFNSPDGGQLTTPLVVGQSDIKLNITAPMKEFSEFAVCLSPLDYPSGQVPLWKLLEWRTSFSDLGVERVNWYFRSAYMKQFVDEYNALTGSHDVFLQTPNLLDHQYRDEPRGWEHYGDQDVWYEECILNNIYSSDFILVLDVDEFFMVNWNNSEPLEQFKSFMRSMPPSKGTVEFDRIEMARPSERGPPPWDDLLQLSFDCYNSGTQISGIVRTGTVVKVMYRAKSVIAVNQHKSRQMYPMPPDVAAAAKKKKNERYQWHLQRSYRTNVWPKLVHYRWYNWAHADVCEFPSFMRDMKGYRQYLMKLKERVAAMAEKLAFVNKLGIPEDESQFS